MCESLASTPGARRAGLAVVASDKSLVRKVDAGRMEGGLRARKLQSQPLINIYERLTEELLCKRTGPGHPRLYRSCQVSTYSISIEALTTRTSFPPTSQLHLSYHWRSSEPLRARTCDLARLSFGNNGTARLTLVIESANILVEVWISSWRLSLSTRPPGRSECPRFSSLKLT